MRVRRGLDGQGDDEDLLAGEGGDEAGLGGVVDGEGLDAGGEAVGAGGAGEGRDGVAAGGDKGGGDVGADAATGLFWGVLAYFVRTSFGLRWEGLKGATYTDDGDALNLVGEASRLVFGILGGHDDRGELFAGLDMSCRMGCWMGSSMVWLEELSNGLLMGS